MAKPFRFKLKFTIPSFGLCCSKRPSTIIPSVHQLSPMNPKARDVTYPHVPAPPPSTPQHSFTSRVSSASDDFDQKHAKNNSPCESTLCKMGCDGNKEKKVKLLKGQSSVSTWRSSDLLIHSKVNNSKTITQDDQSDESLIFLCTSFSDEFSHEEKHEITIHSPSTSHKQKPKNELIERKIKKQDKGFEFQRQQMFQALENQKGLEEGEKMMKKKKKKKKKRRMGSKASSVIEYCGSVDEGTVKESFAVVKKSNDPYKDFKKSMVETIMEMDMFEAHELEQLLQCFLALNSRCYHGVIIRVFMEIWQLLFNCETCGCIIQKSHCKIG